MPSYIPGAGERPPAAGRRGPRRRPDSGTPRPPRQRTLPFRTRPAQVALACIMGCLGWAIVFAIDSLQGDEFRVAREADLLTVLDGLDQESKRQSAELAALADRKQELEASAGDELAAVEQARKEYAAWQLLAGTVAARGPGIEVKVTDPARGVEAHHFITAVNELRDAGAEAMSIRGADGTETRINASTWFAQGQDPTRSLSVAGVLLQPPYTIRAIGDTDTMTVALSIPGGFIATVRGAGGDAVVTPQKTVTIRVVARATTPRWAVTER